MLGVVLGLASWLYLPGDFAAVPKSALAVLLFASNLWFFAKTGYFAGGAETMPLLQCWSLAVEEQFYIVFPLLLRALASQGKPARLLLVGLVAAGSFGWALAKQASTDGFAFYMLPPRSWELMAGALLALGAVPQVRPGQLREGLAALGLALIAGSVALYTKATVFPGLAALPPVLGAALLIHCAPGSLVGRLLAMPLLVGIGLISYSLYLWHWPLLVFAEYARDAKLAGWWPPAYLATAVLAGWASWKWIEAPFRDNRRFDQARVFRWSAAGLAMAALAAGALLPLGGWAGRFSPAVNRFDTARLDYSPHRAACLSRAVGGERPACTLGAPVPPDTALWGDSHGVELAAVLGERAGAQQRAVMLRTRGSCPPVIGYDPPRDPDCARFNAEVLQRLATTPAIRTVWLAGFWASPSYAQPGMADKLDATIAALQRAGKQVVLVGPVPPQPFEVPRRLAHAAAFAGSDPVRGADPAETRRATRWLSAHYPQWRARGVRIIEPLDALSQGQTTLLTDHGQPLYFDSHHLSLTGARLVLDRLCGAGAYCSVTPSSPTSRRP
jgi:peptidoglycan/LPS O-acetylase OafA/YrhL